MLLSLGLLLAHTIEIFYNYKCIKKQTKTWLFVFTEALHGGSSNHIGR